MSNLAFDRFVSGGNWTFDRLVDVNGTPAISSIGTVQDGEAITITGTNFSGSGNTVYLTQDGTTLQVPISSEGTTSITTAALDASGFYITRAAAVTVVNASSVSSNAAAVTILPATGWAARAIDQEFLGAAATRLEGIIDLAFGDEILVGNVQGGTISDIHLTGQGAFDELSTVTAFDLVIQDGTGRGAVATQTIGNPVTTATVPNVTGKTQGQAISDIVAVGLVAAVVASVPSTTVTAGSVTDQFPATTTVVPLGSTVELTLSLGSNVALVPNLIGLLQADALAALTSAGLSGSAYRVIDGNNSGLVVNQSVAPGQPVALNTLITFAVSSNLMPNLVGQLYQNAAAIVQTAGLSLNDVIKDAYSGYAIGFISAQSPLADSVISPLGLVALTVSIGDDKYDSLLQSQLDPTGNGRGIMIERRVDVGAKTNYYVVPMHGHLGHARWVEVTTSDSGNAKAAAILAALA